MKKTINNSIQVMLIIFISILFSCSKESASTTPVSEDYSGLYSGILTTTISGTDFPTNPTSSSNLSIRISKDNNGHYISNQYFNSDKKIIYNIPSTTSNGQNAVYEWTVYGKNLDVKYTYKSTTNYKEDGKYISTTYGTLTKQ
jgi:hypothetical protein